MDNWVKVEFFIAPNIGRRFDFGQADTRAMLERLAYAVAPNETVYVDGLSLVAVDSHPGLARIVDADQRVFRPRFVPIDRLPKAANPGHAT